MSLTLSLASAIMLAVASVGSVGTLTAIAEQADKTERRKKGENVPIQLQCVDTVFVDGELLVETLKAHGSCVSNIQVVSENEILVDTEVGQLRYIRSSVTENFKLEFGLITDQQKFIDQLKSFEKEYGKNVQDYTYNHIKENLTEDMKIESEEVLDDDSLMLTTDI